MPTLVTGQTYATNISGLFSLDFTPGACHFTFIGDFINSETGVSVQMGDLALCPDGILYGTSFNSFPEGLYEINPINAEVTLIMALPSVYISLGCSPDFRLIGVGGEGGGEVLEFFLGGLPTYSVVGQTGYSAAGDIVYYNDHWYHTTSDGLLEIPHIDVPANNQLIYITDPYAGITVSPFTCNSLIVPALNPNEYSEIDLTTGNITPICDIGIPASAGMTSMFEFQTPPPCPLILDLDDDDSSGLPDADYLGDMYTCATANGLNIADDDVYISSQYDIVDVTINIEMGLVDSPDEILILNTANNISIAGSGTDQIILSNIGGATVEDFEMAISNVKYFNQKPYPTPGVREIKVVFEDTDGEISNDAIGYITVTQYEDLIVDLGPDIMACESEETLLDAGQGDIYNWSTGEMTQSISTNLPGIYAVTVTENPKCPGMDTIEVFYLPEFNFTLDVEGPICAGEDFILYMITDYDGIFDIELLNVYTDELHFFQNVVNGDILTISNLDYTFLQINQIIPQLEDICVIDVSGLLEVVINDMIIDTTEAFICENDSIYFRGAYLKEEGAYLDTIESTLSCDSLMIFNLKVYPNYIDTILQFSCDPADVGLYRDTLSTIVGCDSIVILDINLSPTHDITIVNTSCDFQQVIDTIILFTNQYGCDSTVHSIVNYALADTMEITNYTCNPTEIDTIIQELVSSEGCDSIVISTGVLLSSVSIYVELYTCDSNAIGIVVNTEMNVNGCDSLIYENYIYQEPSIENLLVVVCDPTSQGLQMDTLMSSFGCDSIFVITENVYLSPDTIKSSQPSCDPLIVGVNYNSLINIYGCDSIIEEMTISYLPLDTVYLQQSTCNSSLVGSEFDFFTTEEDCDSIVKTEVFFTPLDTTYVFDTSCHIDSIGIDLILLNTKEGCDSIVKTEVFFTPFDTTYISGTSCHIDSIGTNYILLNTTEGCDSIVKKEVFFTPLDTTYIIDTSCELDSIGINYIILNTTEGCDSIIAKFISFVPPDTTFSILETCDITLNNTIDTLTYQTGECDSLVIESSYYVGSDTTFLSETTCIESEAGLFTINLSNIFGCDSTVVRDIALTPSHNVLITDTICYITNDSIEEILLINQFGCDSIITIEKIYKAPHLDLGIDQSIIFGEEVILEVNTSISDGDLLWSSDPFLGQEELNDLTLMPEEDITITLQISNPEGCTATDQIEINVENPKTLILPNVFSPNSDGINDMFTFNLIDYDIELLEALFIFDRWGNKVYSVNNMNTTTSFGWNGEVEGQEVISGVYILYAQLRMLSGENMNIVQDLTVLR